MAKLSRKIWAGLGTVSLVAAGTFATTFAPASAQHGGHGAKAGPAPTATEKDSGALANPKAGEAYLTDGGPKDTRIRLARDTLLMRGHLLIADELIAAGNWDDALPHVLHPTEELYGLMERYIKLHKSPAFDKDLKALAQTVKAKNKAAYLRQAARVSDKLTAHAKFYERFMIGAPRTSFTAKTLVEVMKVAQAEYEAAIEGDGFGKPVEYQDSRGFVLYAAMVLEAEAGAFAQVDAAKLADMRAALAALKPAWPAAIPPPKPVVDAATVAAGVAAFETAARAFFR